MVWNILIEIREKIIVFNFANQDSWIFGSLQVEEYNEWNDGSSTSC